MKSLSIDIINDQHIFSGTYTHIVKIYENLRIHGYDSKFYHFSLQSDINSLPPGAVIKEGLFSFLNSKYSFIYNLKLGANFLIGKNWRSFKGLDGNIQILSGPTLLPLTDYYHNTVVVGHDLYYLNHRGRSTIEQLYMKKMYNLFNKSKFIITDSEFTKKEFTRRLQINKDKIKVVYPYFDSSIFHPGESNIRDILNIGENEKILLSVAGDQPNKNIETVIRLLKLLPDNYKLIRVGRNFGTIKLASELNLGKRVIFLGNVDSDMLANLYRGSDIFIFPSLFEGFGIPVLEAMASGIPVITSDRASLPEVVGDAGIVCDPFDLKFMRNSILEITENDFLKAELVGIGLERSKIFSSERQFKALNAIVEKVWEQ